MEIPKQYTDMVGTRKLLSGGIFSSNRDEPEKEYDVLDIRFGSGFIVNIEQMRGKGDSDYRHPTFELLIKNESMQRARWTRGFPIREINMKEQES